MPFPLRAQILLGQSPILIPYFILTLENWPFKAIFPTTLDGFVIPSR